MPSHKEGCRYNFFLSLPLRVAVKSACAGHGRCKRCDLRCREMRDESADHVDPKPSGDGELARKMVHRPTSHSRSMDLDGTRPNTERNHETHDKLKTQHPPFQNPVHIDVDVRMDTCTNTLSRSPISISISSHGHQSISHPWTSNTCRLDSTLDLDLQPRSPLVKR